MTYIPTRLRTFIIERSGDCCEYCLLSSDDGGFTFHIEHIKAEKHGGETTEDNLCYSCPHCNRYKGSDIASDDPKTGELTRLYNPRNQNWDEHFEVDNDTGYIIGTTPEGRVTVFLLQMNSAEQLDLRAILIQLKRYPCTSN